MAGKENTTTLVTQDGVNHINIWYRGATELGRMLSHFYELRFVHPFFGPFNSMEGFWHYIKSEEKDDELRLLAGQEARNYGKKLSPAYVPGFAEIINTANFYKIEQSPKLKQLFVDSDLPFEHYYLFGPGEVLIRPKGHAWLISGFEKSRRMMKAGQRPVEIDYSKLAKRS